NGRFKADGLDVKVRAPSDPSEPIKLVAAGKVDLGISYEPELLRARDRGLPVEAVAALVRTPLTTIISLPKADIRSPADLPGTSDVKRDPNAAVDALLKASPDLKRKLQEESVRVTTPFFLPPPGKPYGYMDRAEWSRFDSFMVANRLLKKPEAAGALTNALLP